jgi:glucose-1-phosphate thymidylyltransferase
MLAGIRDILIISTPNDLPLYRRLLSDGKNLGININYMEQPQPDGIAQAFVLGENFIGNSPVSLILGDNIFYGYGFSSILKEASNKIKGATIFGYHVSDPERFGVVEFDKNNKVISIEEKPQQPKSNYAVTGLYFYDNDVVEISKNIKPSGRGELEITDVNKVYQRNNNLDVITLGRGFTWLDTGTHESLLDASNFIKTIESKQGLKIGCIEEIAFRNNWISKEELELLVFSLKKTEYGHYLASILK